MPMKGTFASVNAAPLYANVTNQRDAAATMVSDHRKQETDVLGPFGMPEAPRIGPTSDGSRIERWLGPDAGLKG